jgi:hypothetical protein
MIIVCVMRIWERDGESEGVGSGSEGGKWGGGGRGVGGFTFALKAEHSDSHEYADDSHDHLQWEGR